MSQSSPWLFTHSQAPHYSTCSTASAIAEPNSPAGTANRKPQLHGRHVNTAVKSCSEECAATPTSAVVDVTHGGAMDQAGVFPRHSISACSPCDANRAPCDINLHTAISVSIKVRIHVASGGSLTYSTRLKWQFERCTREKVPAGQRAFKALGTKSSSPPRNTGKPVLSPSVTPRGTLPPHFLVVSAYAVWLGGQEVEYRVNLYIGNSYAKHQFLSQQNHS